MKSDQAADRQREGHPRLHQRSLAASRAAPGLRQVDVGNIVHAADTTGIVIITQVRPIAVHVHVAATAASGSTRPRRQGRWRSRRLETGHNTVIDPGTLQVIDNQVDQTTGT